MVFFYISYDCWYFILNVPDLLLNCRDLYLGVHGERVRKFADLHIRGQCHTEWTFGRHCDWFACGLLYHRHS